jgi:hypothetical protein
LDGLLADFFNFSIFYLIQYGGRSDQGVFLVSLSPFFPFLSCLVNFILGAFDRALGWVFFS